ncbi:MAG: GDP-mannose dehydrogenase, partial [Candidatus Eisenbacteria sp.]|nr:GDP-mannose dehydrogenase [Candidatus Eisenbacteria bacterium]
MRISVLGLGYVGCVSAACFTELGHEVVGLDIDARKIELLGSGTSPIVEPGLPELVKKGVDGGRLTVTDDYEAAVMGSDISLVCVGTPSMETGRPNLEYTKRVCRQLADVI